MFNHIVFIRLKDSNSELQQATRNRLVEMDGKIESLKSMEVGVDVLHTERSYDLALITRFASFADMQMYQVHPVHQEVLAYLETVAESKVTVDYQN